jgi:O-methyltransferase
MRAVKKLLGKSNELLARLRLSKLARKMQDDGLTYLAHSKLLRLEQEARRLNTANISGDFCEFGLAAGGSGIVLANLLTPNRRFHGFDVFEMIPAPTHAKDGSNSVSRYEKIASGKSKGLKGKTYYGYEENLFSKVKSYFAENNLPVGDQIRLHRGLFEQTWPLVSDSVTTIALAHIDCDWYDPVRYCLDICRSKLSAGGAVIVDDYYAYEGARTATDEFLSINPDFKLQLAGKHVVLVRRS